MPETVGFINYNIMSVMPNACCDVREMHSPINSLFLLPAGCPTINNSVLSAWQGDEQMSHCRNQCNRWF